MSETPDTLFAPGDYDVCDADDLLAKTQCGWRLKQVLRHVGDVVAENQPIANPSPSNGYPPPCGHGTTQTTRWVPLERPRFLVWKDEDTRTRELVEALDAAEKEASVLRSNAEASDRLAQRLRAENETLASGSKAVHARWSDTNDELTRKRNEARKLEGDITKITNDIGTDRMREILGT